MLRRANRRVFSYYDYLADCENFNRIFIIKGGPGTGKSTTMKTVGKWAEGKGFDVDYIHCSSDPDSLDGIVIGQIKVAMVDGTSPHIIDPKNAGAVETIINMGDFWQEEKIKENKKKIMTLNSEISKKFQCSYNYLAAAGSLNKNSTLPVNKKEVLKISNEILSNISFASVAGSGKVRKLFSEAITPDGIVSYADRLKYDNRIVLKSEILGMASEVLKSICYRLNEMGYDLEVFYSPINPNCDIRHIVIPEANLCILTSDMLSIINESGAEVYDLDISVEQKKLSSDFLKSKLFSMTLITQAISHISAAKRLHDKLEGYYVPYIDFDAMQEKRQEILDQLEKMTQ